MSRGLGDVYKRQISNFLNNAIKYTSEGCITLAYEIIGDEIKFSVTDTGDGMSQEIQAHIFDRFYMGESGKTGIGLALTKEIIHLHKGRICACNGEPGAVFEISIPAGG